MSSSTYTINKFIQNTASFLSGNAVSNNIVSTSITGSLTGSVSGSLYGTASWAMNVVNGGTGGTSVATLTTGQLYHITSSWAETASLAKTSSIASYANNFPFPRVVAAVSFKGDYQSGNGSNQYISSSYNVTTVTRFGVRTGFGKYNINFTTPIALPYYVVMSLGFPESNASSEPFNDRVRILSQTSTYLQIKNDNLNGLTTLNDAPLIDVMIFKNNVDNTIVNDVLNSDLTFTSQHPSSFTDCITDIRNDIIGITALSLNNTVLQAVLKLMIANLNNNVGNRLVDFTYNGYTVDYNTTDPNFVNTATPDNIGYSTYKITNNNVEKAHGWVYFLKATGNNEITFDVILTNI